MFTSADYEKYFDQIARVERKMIYGSYELGLDREDPAVVRFLKRIGDDEVRHYGYVLKMLKDISNPIHLEHRREYREYCLGIIRLWRVHGEATENVKAYCVNLSQGGICLECDRELFAGEEWNLEIKLFGQAESKCYQGKVAWSRKVEENFFINGMAFGAPSKVS